MGDIVIIKNNYVIALLVFVALVVAFNVADSYSKNDSNQITGLALFGGSFSRITYLLQDVGDFIFRDILERTVIGSFILYTDAIIRLILFIVLYIVIYGIFSSTKILENKTYENFIPREKKYSKIISAIIALMTAVFIPREVIASIFGMGGETALFGGFLSLVIWGAVIFLPIYILFKWIRKTRIRFSSFLAGVLFLGWLFVITAVETRMVSFVFKDLWDILIAFGNLACVGGFFWGVWKGFSMPSPSRSSRKPKEGMDEFIGRGGARGEVERAKNRVRGLLLGGASINQIAERYAKIIKSIKAKVKNPKEQGERIASLYLKYRKEAHDKGISSEDADLALKRRVKI